MRWCLLGLLILGCGSSDEAASDPTDVSPTERETPEATDEEATDEAEAPHDEAPPPEAYFPGVPAYPNARFLCSQHITGTGGHIEWRGYATADDLATVRAFYERRFNAPGAPPGSARFEPNGEGFQITAEGGRSVSAHPAGGAHPSCDVASAESDRTYLVVSTLTQ